MSSDWRTGECGLAILRGGQRTCWFALPNATIGHILDRENLAPRIADRLLLLMRIALPLADRVTPAIGLDPVTSTTRLGKAEDASATTASLNSSTPERIRIDPEDAFSPEDLRRTMPEVAEELVARLAAPLKR
ncbi:hypothetical protein [Amycolatopsis sp. NPDC098790]|uniref:hypothetical protein n=1 Tax=Amycolatopsis sp. NPDC098790 TaxID=3363939 RepID=UPI0038253D52